MTEAAMTEAALLSLVLALCAAVVVDANGAHCDSGAVKCIAAYHQYSCGFNWFFPYRQSDLD